MDETDVKFSRSANIEYLLENFSIADIEDIQNKLRHDVEKKKEELKHLVGERYKDLIEAADTIQNMKGTASKIISSIEDLQNFCDSAATRHKKNTSTVVEPNISIEMMPSIKYKLITKTTQMIWACLENNDIINASYAYVRADYILKSLDEAPQPSLIKQYKFILNQMKGILVRFCWSSVKNAYNSDPYNQNVAVEPFACLIFLEDLTIEQLLNEYLIHAKDDSDSCFDGQDEELFNFAAVQFATIFFSTIRNIYYIFFDESSVKSLLLRKTNELTDIKSTDYDDHLFSNYQKSSQFELKPKFDLGDMNKSKINDICKIWIEELRNNTTNNVTNFLTGLKNIHQILNMLNSVDDFLKTENRLNQLEDYCESLMNIYIPLWDTFFSLPVMDRIKFIMESGLIECFNTFHKNSKDLIYGNLKATVMSGYVWMNTSTTDISKLDQLTLGCCSEVFELITNFNNLLSSVLQDTETIFIFKSSTNLISKNDKEDLKMFFFETLKKSLINLVMELNKLIKSSESTQSTLLLGRISRGLVTSCPNLKLAFECIQPGKWEKAREDLMDCSNTAFLKLYKMILEEESNKLMTNMLNKTPIEYAEMTSVWEELNLDEAVEEGKNVKFVVKVPVQISIPFYEFLNNVCCRINENSGHTLPTSLAIELLINISEPIQMVYKFLLKELNELTTFTFCKQRRALQYYFDLLYYQQMLGTAKNESIKKKVMPKIRELFTEFESLIDPFDLHVFFPQIQTNLARVGRNTSLIFGLILNDMTSNQTKKEKSNKQADIHNLIYFSTLNTSLPLLSLESTSSFSKSKKSSSSLQKK